LSGGRRSVASGRCPCASAWWVRESSQIEPRPDQQQVWVAGVDAVAVELPEAVDRARDACRGRVVAEEVRCDRPQRLALQDGVRAVTRRGAMAISDPGGSGRARRSRGNRCRRGRGRWRSGAVLTRPVSCRVAFFRSREGRPVREVRDARSTSRGAVADGALDAGVGACGAAGGAVVSSGAGGLPVAARLSSDQRSCRTLVETG